MKQIIKTTLISIILFSTSIICCRAQSDNPFYEQNAFDFYRTEIVQKTQIKGKLKITTKLKSLYYLSAECLKNKIYNEKNIKILHNSKYFQGYQLNIKDIDRKQFRKVKKINKNLNSEKFVEVSVAYEFENRIFVVIYEFVAGHYRDYTFEFNREGKIIDWCKSSETEQLIFE